MTALAHHQGLLAAGISGLTAWNPAYLSANAMLAADDRELHAGLTGLGNYATSRSNSALYGLVYFSGRCEKGPANNFGFGVADAAAPLTASGNFVGSGNSIGLWYEGRVYQNGSITHQGFGVPSSADIEVAVRVAQRRVWLRRDGQGWIGGGDPATDTTPTGILGGTGALYIAGTIDPGSTLGGLIRLPATPAGITRTPPAGFEVGVP